MTTRILRLLLLAALAWPTWMPATAQEVMRVEKKNAVAESSTAMPISKLINKEIPQELIAIEEGKVHDKLLAPQKQEKNSMPMLPSKKGKKTSSNGMKMKKISTKGDKVTATPPASATIEEWKIDCNFNYVGSDDNWVSTENYSSYSATPIQVAIDGNNIYISGLCPQFSSVWIKGTISGSIATFPTGQYYGTDTSNNEDYEFWFVGEDINDQECDVVFTYDALAKKLTQQTAYINNKSAETGGSYYNYFKNSVIYFPKDITICDGSASNQYIPVYGYWIDTNGTESQMIYPTSKLEGLNIGDRIKAITFYTYTSQTATVPAKLGSATVEVRMGETTASTINSSTMSANREAANKVYEGMLSTGSNSMTITFTEPYVYQGKNLLIDTYVTNGVSQQYATCYWAGESASSGASYNNRNSTQNFLPKIKIEWSDAEQDESLNFETVEVGESKTLNAIIRNNSTQSTMATITLHAPFKASSTSVMMAPGTNIIPVTFTPTAAINYNDELTIELNGETLVIALTGIGNITGSPAALRDADFFEGITYEWTDDTGATHNSNLTEVATDPNQIIAMLKEVYTNKTIPGNFKRGCDANGNFTENYSDVSYSAVGAPKYKSSYTDYLNNPNYYEYSDSYGWNIPTNKSVICKTESSYSYSYPTYYAYFDQTEYKPNNEGLTMLLIEIPDDYDRQTFGNDASEWNLETNADVLKYVITKTVKSARIITEAKRTGEGLDAGTLFKIDCDKMNKFYLIAKGQVRLPFNSMVYQVGETANDYSFYGNCNFSPYPMFVYSQRYYGQYGKTVNGAFWDYNSGMPLYHMFEQFSPVALSTGDDASDLYKDLVNMKSFKVQHDCVSVPTAYSGDETQGHGHQFMMYGNESESWDCQDVRGLMFFVPDYRMMKDNNRDSQPLYYLNYNTEHSPIMGLYVIRQDEITPTAQTDDYYMLQLNWRTNLDNFLPSDAQEFELFQVIVDENGDETYVPVYYMNAQGQYTDAEGNVVDETNKVAIVLHMEAGEVKNYPNVYVKRLSSSQQVTYAIQGRDAADENGKHFLSLQMSNQQSFIIPGTDPNEMIMLSDAIHYSRFNPQTVKNCYSNRLLIANNAIGLNNNNIVDGADGTKLYVTRSHMDMVDGEMTTINERIATITFNNHNDAENRSITVTMENQSPKNEYPNGLESGEGAGYHANKGDISWTQKYSVVSEGSNAGNIIFNPALYIYDNFVVDISKNDHPSSYTYRVETNYAGSASGSEVSTAYSNAFRVRIYKTDSQINEFYTKEQVDNDLTGYMDLDEQLEFGTKVQYSSKTEILRYDAYRWGETEERHILSEVGEKDYETENPPTGMAANQGGNYTVSMNKVNTDDYYTSAVAVNPGEDDKWATFVDYVPQKATQGTAYIYAPVIELFTSGKNEYNKERKDYNTYGGPLQSVATGKLNISVVPASKNNPLMSSYIWEDAEHNKYCYYNINLNVDTKSVPPGYDIYKIRAWREIEENLLAEEHDIFNERVNNSYKFEELTYPDYDKKDAYVLGSKEDEFVDPSNNRKFITSRGTFGARKLRTSESETGVIDNLDACFFVRIYFTRKSNLPQTSNVSSPRIKGDDEEPVLPKDDKYYIVEASYDFHIEGSNNIITAIDQLNAREVAGVKYYNVAGVESDRPFKGVNIVVTRYSDGSMSTTKIVK